MNKQEGQITWESPSNIAIIKYWGKHGIQLPENPSLSMTLSKCKTVTSLAYKPEAVPSDKVSYDFFFHGEKKDSFRAKIDSFFEKVIADFPFLKTLDFEIRSENSFPHSSGIASSASSMSALALCLCSLDEMLGRKSEDKDLNSFSDEFLSRASNYARLGSGSASRSVYPGFVTWGKHHELEGSTNLQAQPLPFEVHEFFSDYRDAVLIIDPARKSVSSRAGHKLMQGHPYALNRYKQASGNLSELLRALKTGDAESFVRITEQEALTLHALMMMSDPYFLLLKEHTLTAIDEIRNFRQEQNIPVAFTLDAGPNVHLLYPGSFAEPVEAFITERLKPLCAEEKIIFDHIGQGPEIKACP